MRLVPFDGALLPTALTARTRNQYVPPFVSPVITCDVAVDSHLTNLTGWQPW